MDGMSLLDVLRGVMLDPAEQAAYNADPGAYLGQYGYDDVDPADLSEAFGLVADTLPPEQAQAAWSGAADPDGASFGSVTADFDGDAGISDGGTAPPDIDVDAPEHPGEAEAEVEAPLSFGDGVDSDDPSFDEATDDAGDGLSGDDPGDGGDLDGSDPTDDLDEIDFGAADEGGDLAFDTVDDGLDDFDDTDDLGEIDGLGDHGDPSPDELDIGSF